MKTMASDGSELFTALGDGWLGKAMAASIAGVAAWFLRRPTERSALITAVDNRIDSFTKTLMEQVTVGIARCERLEQRLIADRKICDEQIAAVQHQLEEAINGRIVEVSALRESLPLQPFPGLDPKDGSLGNGLK